MKRSVLVLATALTLAACGEKPAEKKGAPATLITTTQAKVAALEIAERTLGTLTAVKDPAIAAEVAGKVVKMLARSGQAVKKGQLLAQIDATDSEYQAASDQGEIARLEALLAQQERVLARQNELLQKNFISKNALDDVAAQRDALKNQLASARAKAGLSRNNVGKTRVLAPFDGVIEVQIASTGDYIKLGDPLFRFVANDRLRADLPFPESAAPRLQAGMAVRLTTPLAPDETFEAVIEDIRPTVGEGNRAVLAIARLDNPGPLKGGASVDAAVITGRKERAVLVPEQAVVLRPAGKVVYLVADGKAKQQVVEVGGKQGGQIEITKGLQGGEMLALDGAGFLSDGAAVNIKETAKTTAAAQPATKPQ